MYSRKQVTSIICYTFVFWITEGNELSNRRFRNSISFNKYFNIRQGAEQLCVHIRNNQCYALYIIIIFVKQSLCKQRTMRVGSMTYYMVSMRESTITATRLQSAPRILKIIVYEHVSKAFVQRRSTLLDTTSKRFFCNI